MYYVIVFFIDFNFFLICVDNFVNIFLLILIVVKCSDGIEMGDIVLFVVNVCLNGRIILNKMIICLNSFIYFY